MADKELELYHVYSATGHQDSRERWVHYTLIVGEGNRQAKVTLLVETLVSDDGDNSRSAERYELQVEDLAKLIMERGTKT